MSQSTRLARRLAAGVHACQDGDNDLADIGHCNKASILLNDGHGTFRSNGSYGNGSASRSIALADFNGDGSKDIAYVNDAVGANSNVTVLMNNGNATFGAPQFYWVWDMSDDLAVGDFDHDGDVDLAVANSYYSLVFFLINTGDGDFNGGYSEIPGGNAPTGIAAADFNADGRLDYALTSWSSSSLFLYLNKGYYVYDGAAFSVGQGPVDVAVGRLDGDSLPDLVTVNHQGGSITALLTSAAAQPPPPPPPPPAQITLSLSTRKTRTERQVELRWSGATSSAVDIYRNGSRRVTTSNSGSYTDRMSRSASGTFRYKVCVAGSQVCSNEAAISF